jgi:hypothetical protein
MDNEKMDNPFWFYLIKQWREQNMGQYGVSLPFLVGAIARQFGGEITENFIKDILQEIIEYPAKGYYCEVRWCGNIDEPVVSIESINVIKNKSIQAQFTNINGEPSLAFTTDLMSMFNLNCKNKEDCLDKLIARALEKAKRNLFSKNNGVFGDFTEKEISSIEGLHSKFYNT